MKTITKFADLNVDFQNIYLRKFDYLALIKEVQKEKKRYQSKDAPIPTLLKHSIDSIIDGYYSKTKNNLHKIRFQTSEMDYLHYNCDFLYGEKKDGYFFDDLLEFEKESYLEYQAN